MSASAFDRFKTKYKSGQYVFKDGDLGTEMYILQSGRVDLVKEVLGREEVIADLENLPRNLSARAVEDSELIAINGTTFDKMIKSNIEIAVRMLRKFSTRLREADAENLRLRTKVLDVEAGASRAGGVPSPAPL